MESSWTMIRRALRALSILVCALAASIGQSRVASSGEVRIVVIEREDDALYEPASTSDGLYRLQRYRPFVGAELGLADISPLGMAADVTFRLERWSLPPEDSIEGSIRQAASRGIAAALLDLPVEDLKLAAKAMPSGKIALFNIREQSDDLRRDVCGTDLFHVIPSQSGLTDALAQFVVRRNWRKILMMVGPEESDTTLAKSFERSAKKFGARIVDTKPFVSGNDPRNREQTNVTLMTSAVDYDALFLADTVGDFGRFVPYRMSRPRPVFGTEGLQASGWYFTSERYGAPQLNRRFERLARRQMTDPDWSAWVAVRTVGEIVARTAARAPSEIVRNLREGAIPIDLSKGVTGSFRKWDQQLRQPIMLHTYNAVIDFAPLDGFLHEHSTLDTLGLESRDVPCGRP
jgi:ABC transporter substrate binding protein (PQQ-dependent alcohol dehydrogenase system)